MRSKNTSFISLTTRFTALIAAAGLQFTSLAQTSSETPTIQVKADQVTGKVSPTLYGLMTEEINFSYEGGLYGELIRNRTFKASMQNPVFWAAVGDTTLAMDTNQP